MASSFHRDMSSTYLRCMCDLNQLRAAKQSPCPGPSRIAFFALPKVSIVVPLLGLPFRTLNTESVKPKRRTTTETIGKLHYMSVRSSGSQECTQARQFSPGSGLSPWGLGFRVQGLVSWTQQFIAYMQGTPNITASRGAFGIVLYRNSPLYNMKMQPWPDPTAKSQILTP